MIRQVPDRSKITDEMQATIRAMLADGESVHNIAAAIGIGRDRVRNWMTKQRLQAAHSRPHGWHKTVHTTVITEALGNEIRRMVAAGHSTFEVTTELGVNRDALMKWTRKYGVEWDKSAIASAQSARTAMWPRAMRTESERTAAYNAHADKFGQYTSCAEAIHDHGSIGPVYQPATVVERESSC